MSNASHSPIQRSVQQRVGRASGRRDSVCLLLATPRSTRWSTPSRATGSRAPRAPAARRRCPGELRRAAIGGRPPGRTGPCSPLHAGHAGYARPLPLLKHRTPGPRAAVADSGKTWWWVRAELTRQLTGRPTDCQLLSACVDAGGVAADTVLEAQHLCRRAPRRA